MPSGSFDNQESFILAGFGLFFTIFSGVLAYSLTHNIYAEYGVSMGIVLAHIVLLVLTKRR